MKYNSSCPVVVLRGMPMVDLVLCQASQGELLDKHLRRKFAGQYVAMTANGFVRGHGQTPLEAKVSAICGTAWSLSDLSVFYVPPPGRDLLLQAIGSQDMADEDSQAKFRNIIAATVDRVIPSCVMKYELVSILGSDPVRLDLQHGKKVSPNEVEHLADRLQPFGVLLVNNSHLN